jgi:molecular chaperone DnaK (HSP70)
VGLQPREAPPQPRFIVGIDLGTTNSVVAFVDTSLEDGKVEVLRIPQLTAPGMVEARDLLPSFLYIPADGEFAATALDLPWKNDSDVIVGTFAQQHGAEVPTRIVTSAKSWLSHAGVDRTAPILPWGSPEEVTKLSPVGVSARYLEHIRQAWNAEHKDALLEEQEVLLTVPASFDAVARDLTVVAARDAGLPHVTILEEPQAAFYSWIDARGEGWREAVRLGDLVLVCDVGGGTTDLSLIAVQERDGELTLERVAVGDHILLGGDNMDLSLAYQVRERLALEGVKLDSWQFRGLVQGCREAKERLLSDRETTSYAVSILGRGRKVVGGTLRTEIRHADVERTLIDGFFPVCKIDDRPESQHRTGLQELGLPYAADPAVTRHLAQFLTRQHAADGKNASGTAARPTAILFNGGAMRASFLRQRLLEVVDGWFSDRAGGVRALEGGDPERAVARGAAYYGLARRGRGVRIRGGTASTYYIGIETAMPAVPGIRTPIKALCVVPRGLEEGSEVDLPAREFGLIVGQPAEFRFLSSATRRDDEVGTLVDSWDDEEIEESAPLETTLDWQEHEGTTVPVHLQARVNEVGVLELWCVSRDEKQRWKLEFNVRSADRG